MRKFFRITMEIVSDAIYGTLYFVENQLYNFSNIIYFLLPYAMLFTGEYTYKFRNEYAVGGEVFLPLFALFIIWVLRSYANRLGKGIDVPVPERRFTSVNDDGEVSVSRDRINELLLYTADLEDWLERKGIS